MTAMDVKEELTRIKAAQKEYELARDEAIRFDTMLGSPKAVRFGERIPHTPDNGTEQIYVTAMMYHERAKQLEIQMLKGRERCEQLLSLLPYITQREVVKRYYLFGNSWEEVADIVGYSVRQATRVRDKALKIIAEKLESETQTSMFDMVR